jgi:hypothetical protein
VPGTSIEGLVAAATESFDFEASRGAAGVDDMLCTWPTDLDKPGTHAGAGAGWRESNMT